MLWDDEPMGYTEIIWLRENHISAYIPDGPHDYDRGLHVLVGEKKFRGGVYSQPWFRSVEHYVFLSDPRTVRIFGEPKANNPAIIKMSLDAGMHVQSTFYFPYKHSALTRHSRDKFFKLDLLT